jgi:hypothetical protein
VNDIEREYKYKPRWWAVLLLAGFYGGVAVVLGLKASSNDPDNIPVLYGGACALAVGSFTLVVLRVVAGLLFRHRVALTQTHLILPRSPWSSEEVAIEYQAISGLSTSADKRYLDVTYPGGKRRIRALLLPSRAAFEEVCGLLTARVRASQQADRPS